MYLDPPAVACPCEPLFYSMDVRYHNEDVLVVCSTIVVVVGLVVSRIMSIVDVMFAVHCGYYVCSPLWMLCLQLNLLCRLFRDHGGKLQACKAFIMCSISLWSACCLVETTLALCAKVLKTLCFAMMKWLLFQGRYWSVCGLSVD